MEILKEIVQNILIIVLLNVLLEMLMPSSELSRYIKLVMGLFIIVAVLNPVLGFLDRDISFMALQTPDNERELKGLLEKGRAIGEEKHKAAVTELEQRIAQQVLALARLDGKAEVQKVVVEAEENPGHADFGSLKEIVVYLGQQEVDNNSGDKDSKDNIRVAPVEINVHGPKSSQELKEAVPAQAQLDQLREVLADFYGIDRDRITVVSENK